MKTLHKITLFILLVFSFSCINLNADVAKNYKKNCKKCHDKDGSGNTKVGQKKHVKDYTDPAVLKKFTDEELFNAIKDGVTEDGKVKMKGFGEKLSDEEIHELVAFCRAFAKSK